MLFSPPQCAACISGYVGNPQNSSQCYKLHEINTVVNYTVSAKQTQFIAIPGTNFRFSDVDVKVFFDVESGEIDVYATADSQAIQVASSESGEHVISFRSDVDVVDRGGSTVRLNSDTNTVYHTSTDGRQLIIIPYSSQLFGYSFHYFTVFAQETSKFYFYYRQDPPKLNLVVFFAVFLSCFCIAGCSIVLVWKFFHIINYRRRVRRRIMEQQARRSRPFGSVLVYFDETLFAPMKKDAELLSSSEEYTSGNEEHDGAEPPQSAPRKHVQRLRMYNLFKAHRGPSPCSTPSQSTNTKTSIIKHPDIDTAAKVTVDDLRNNNKWPVAVQPTKDNRASVSTVLIQLPSKRAHSYAMCTGSALVDASQENINSLHRRRKRFSRNACLPAEVNTMTTRM